MSAQTFLTGCGRLIQTSLYKFVEMILRVTIQCYMAEISLNRIIINLENMLMDLYFYRPFSEGLFFWEFLPWVKSKSKLVELMSGIKSSW